MSSPETKRRSPYKGLIPYGEGDASFFFGREKETRLISANLFASPLTLLYGASGVGKSSVLRAGVAHQLCQRDDLLVIVFNSWQGNPVGDLMQAIADNADRADHAAWAKATELMSQNQPLSLAEVLATCAAQLGRRLMIILDQFEEYFLYHPHDDEFAAEFPRTVTQTDASVSFLISIREDFYAKLDRFEGRIPALYDNYLRIEHLDRQAARAAIEKPIAEFNRLYATTRPFNIETGLVEEVLSQVETGRVILGEAGRGVVETGKLHRKTSARIETPFLQLVMTRLWDEELAAGSQTLRRETLKRLGGADSIVRTHLDAVMTELLPPEQEIASSVFHYLVTPSGTKIAYTASDLAGSAELDEAKVVGVLEKLSYGDVRILRTVEPSPDRPTSPRFEIFHDVLAPAILAWRANFVQAQERAEAERRAEEQQRKAEEQARIGEQAKSAGRLRRLVAALALVSLLAFGFAVYAFDQRAKADQQAAIAASRELAAAAGSNLNSDPELSVLLSLEAVSKLSRHHSLSEIDEKEAKSSLHQAIAASRAKLTLRCEPQDTGCEFRQPHFTSDANRLVTINAQTATVWDAMTGKKLRVLSAPIDKVEQSALSPDGSLFAVAGLVSSTPNNAGQDTVSKIVLWDIATGEAVNVPYPIPLGRLRKLSFINDSKTLLLAGFVRHPKENTASVTLQLWDVATRRSGEFSDLTMAVPPGTRGTTPLARYVAFSSDAKRILTQLRSGAYQQIYQAMVWDATSHKVLRTFDLRKPALSPKGTLVAGLASDPQSQSGASRLKVLEVDSGEEFKPLRSSEGGTFENLVFSPDGEYLAASTDSGIVKLWYLASGEVLISTPEIPKKSKTREMGETDETGDSIERPTFSFSADGERFAASGSNGTVKVWDSESGNELLTLTGHARFVTSVAFSRVGEQLVSGDAETARVWDLSPSHEVFTLSDLGEVDNIAFSPDGKYLAGARWDGGASVWDAATGKQLYTAGPGDSGVDVTFSPDTKRLALSSRDGQVAMLDAASGKVLHTLPSPSSPETSAAVWEVAFSPDGKRLAIAIAGDQDGTAKVLDAETLQPLHELPGHTGPVRSIAFSPDGKYIATASEDKTVKVWDAQSYRERQRLVGHKGDVWRVAFSPDGKQLATASHDGSAKIWDVASGQELRSLYGHGGKIWGITFSNDGRYVVTTSSDKSTKVWDFRSGEEVLTLTGHTAAVNLGVFSPDGSRLASCSDDGTIRVYTLVPEELKALASQHISRQLTTKEREKYLHEVHK